MQDHILGIGGGGKIIKESSDCIILLILTPSPLGVHCSLHTAMLLIIIESCKPIASTWYTGAVVPHLSNCKLLSVLSAGLILNAGSMTFSRASFNDPISFSSYRIGVRVRTPAYTSSGTLLQADEEMLYLSDYALLHLTQLESSVFLLENLIHCSSHGARTLVHRKLKLCL